MSKPGIGPFGFDAENLIKNALFDMARPEDDDDLKQARGTQRADRRKEPMQITPLRKTVRVPGGLLTRRAKFEYSRVMQALSNDGLAAEVDKSLLIAYCNEIASYFNLANEVAEAEEIVSQMQVTTETMAKYKALLFQIEASGRKRDTALKHSIKLGELFGLTPSARGKIKPSKAKKKEGDPTEEAFNTLMKTA